MSILARPGLHITCEAGANCAWALGICHDMMTAQCVGTFKRLDQREFRINCRVDFYRRSTWSWQDLLACHSQRKDIHRVCWGSVSWESVQMDDRPLTIISCTPRQILSRLRVVLLVYYSFLWRIVWTYHTDCFSLWLDAVVEKPWMMTFGGEKLQFRLCEGGPLEARFSGGLYISL